MSANCKRWLDKLPSAGTSGAAREAVAGYPIRARYNMDAVAILPLQRQQDGKVDLRGMSERMSTESFERAMHSLFDLGDALALVDLLADVERREPTKAEELATEWGLKLKTPELWSTEGDDNFQKPRRLVFVGEARLWLASGDPGGWCLSAGDRGVLSHAVPLTAAYTALASTVDSAGRNGHWIVTLEALCRELER